MSSDVKVFVQLISSVFSESLCGKLGGTVEILGEVCHSGRLSITGCGEAICWETPKQDKVLHSIDLSYAKSHLTLHWWID